MKKPCMKTEDHLKLTDNQINTGRKNDRGFWIRYELSAVDASASVVFYIFLILIPVNKQVDGAARNGLLPAGRMFVILHGFFSFHDTNILKHNSRKEQKGNGLCAGNAPFCLYNVWEAKRFQSQQKNMKNAGSGGDPFPAKILFSKEVGKADGQRRHDERGDDDADEDDRHRPAELQVQERRHQRARPGPGAGQGDRHQ